MLCDFCRILLAGIRKVCTFVARQGKKRLFFEDLANKNNLKKSENNT
jgi:hypothetical protein